MDNNHDSQPIPDAVPDSPTIYVEVAREGEAEMRRPSASLFWSALAAGQLISFSLLAKAALGAEVAQFSMAHMIDSLGYTVGFVLVILSRLQLFTENTISPVLPTIAVPSGSNCRNLGRIWAISIFANLIGTAIMAFMFARTAMISPPVLHNMLEIGREVAELGFGESLIKGIPAGLLIASLVWMRPSAGEAFMALILLVTYVIALAGFTHSIVGSCEIFVLAWSGEGNVFQLLWSSTVPTLLGNVIGGTGLFALISWAQVRGEVQDHHVQQHVGGDGSSD